MFYKFKKKKKKKKKKAPDFWTLEFDRADNTLIGKLMRALVMGQLCLFATRRLGRIPTGLLGSFILHRKLLAVRRNLISHLLSLP